jgi:nucleoside-diphosphate-sugar epimerase
MRILITGTTGFLGRSLADHFSKNHTVIEQNRGGMRIGGAVYMYKPDVIIHCAGEIYEAENMFTTNVSMVNEILESIQEYCPKTRLIQLGSSAEYGPMPRASNEQDPINPVDVYQATKGAATLLCQGYARQFGLQTLVARIYSGYGVNERPHRLFPRLYRAFFNNESMTLRDGVHDFIYIDDFVRGIDIILDQNNWPAGEIVNFGSGTQTTNLEVLEAWERITGRKGAVTYEPGLGKAYESNVWCCDTKYAIEQYGFKTKFTLEQGIEDFIKKMQNVR